MDLEISPNVDTFGDISLRLREKYAMIGNAQTTNLKESVMTTKQFQERSALRIFLSYFRPHQKLFFLDMCCALVICLIDLAFPAVSRWCMYELLPQNAYGAFFAVMTVVFFAFALRAVMQYVICYWGHTFGILVEGPVSPHAGAELRLL